MKKNPGNDKNKRSGIWEIGIVPEPMFGTKKPDGKPFDMVVVVHQISYYILNTNIVAPDKSEKESVVEAFEDGLAKGPVSLPDIIQVKDERLVGYLADVAKKMGVRVDVVKKLPAVQEVIRSMKQWSRHMPIEPEPVAEA